MILRQFEKARRQDEIRAQQPCKEREIQDKILKEKKRDKKLLFVRLSFEGEIHLWEIRLSLFLLRPSNDLNLLQATVVEGGPTSGCTSTRAALLRNPAAPQETSSEGRCHDGAKTQLPARSGECFNDLIVRQTLITRRCRSTGRGTTDQWHACILTERLRSVLEDLRSLSTAVVNSSEDSAEEEEEDRVMAPDHPQADLTWYLMMIHKSPWALM